MLQIHNTTDTSAVLTNTKTLNYEDINLGRGKTFKLKVTVTDLTTNVTAVKTFYNLRVANVNEAPTNIMLSKK